MIIVNMIIFVRALAFGRLISEILQCRNSQFGARIPEFTKFAARSRKNLLVDPVRIAPGIAELTKHTHGPNVPSSISKFYDFRMTNLEL